MKRIREWTLLGGGVVLALALVVGGEPIRGAVVAGLGALGAAVVSRAGRPPRRWPRLRSALGRRMIKNCDDSRLLPTLDAAEDALSAIALEGSELAAVEEGVIDLVRRAIGLAAVRAGHEATLAKIFLEAQASQLELEVRTEHARVNFDLEQIRGVLATVGPSVRHLRLLTAAEKLAAGDAPAELHERVANLRNALSEELAHA
jgi:hypothetical protein